MSLALEVDWVGTREEGPLFHTGQELSLIHI